MNRDSVVAGHADCMVVPNIEAGNLLGKAVKYLGAAQCAHVVVGACANPHPIARRECGR